MGVTLRSLGKQYTTGRRACPDAAGIAIQHDGRLATVLDNRLATKAALMDQQRIAGICDI